MRSKLNYLIEISLGRKIKTKWFVIANILLAVVIGAVINIDSIITFFGGDFNEKQTIYVIDETKESFELFRSVMEEAESSLGQEDAYNIELFEKDVDEVKKIIDEKGYKYMAVVLKPSDTNTLKVELITKEYMDLIDSQLITNAINNTKVSLAILHSNISMEEIESIYSAPEIERTYLDESKKSEDEGMETIMTTFFPVVILPFFMLTIFLVQMIGAEVNDEKTTRGMEIIISNVSPKTHFFAKVIAGNLFVILQGVLLLAYGAIGLGIRHLIGGNHISNGLGSEVGSVISNLLSSEIGSKMIYIIPLVLILMLLTFLAYSLLAGILASMTTNIEDFQQLQTPIMVISLVGYYLAMIAGMFEGAIFIKIFAFVPFISAILAPSLLVLGQIGVFEFMIAIILVIITNYLLIKYGLRIYKVGILNYSSKDLWKKMFHAMRARD